VRSADSERQIRSTRTLAQRAVDRREPGSEIGAEPVHDRDDRERNSGCDQAVLDRGGAGFIGEEFFSKRLS
jgi:hypothetical protein